MCEVNSIKHLVFRYSRIPSQNHLLKKLHYHSRTVKRMLLLTCLYEYTPTLNFYDFVLLPMQGYSCVLKSPEQSMLLQSTLHSITMCCYKCAWDSSAKLTRKNNQVLFNPDTLQCQHQQNKISRKVCKVATTKSYLHSCTVESSPLLARVKRQVLGMKMKTMVLIGVVSVVVLAVVATVVGVSVSGASGEAAAGVSVIWSIT